MPTTRSTRLACLSGQTLGLGLALAPLHAQDARARYRPPTEVELRDAYVDDATRAFVQEARTARLRVDSTLASYRATAYERLTIGGSLEALGRVATLGGRETVGEVAWSRADGAQVTLTGRRQVRNTGLSLPNPSGDELVPVPWYPGMDALWLPSSNGPQGTNGRVPDADTTNLVHPLAIGSESYYRFALGDSAVISLGDGQRIVLRELRARPREPKWNLSVGSYWFDAGRHQLVRAVYRLSVPYDVWTEIEHARGDGDGAPWYLRFLAQPLRGELQAVTLEYGLHDGQIWLPRTRRMDGTIQAGPAQLAVTIEQGFRFSEVNAGTIVAALPDANVALRALYDSLNTDWQQLWRDRRALRSRDDTLAWNARRATLDSAWSGYSARFDAQVRQDCAARGVRYQTGTRLGDALRTRVAIPCDSIALANAPELSDDRLAERARVYGSTMDDATRAALALDVQAAFAPQRVTRHVGLEYLRYNRVEALSVGGALRQQLGAGWQWEANARASLGDRQLNGELFATRTNGGGELTVSAYRRLVQADDYGQAFHPFASLQHVLRGLDEQFYFRSAGAEITRRLRGRGASGLRLETRLFGEWQQGVGTEASVSLPWLMDRTRGFERAVLDTLPLDVGAAWGAAASLLTTHGEEHEGWRFGSAWRAEAVTGAWRYVRIAGDVTIGRALPGAWRVTNTLSAGASRGDLPTHRLWNVGGWQTVRGVQAGTLRGDAFWMTRTELRWARTGRLQPGLFSDGGWAGAREALRRSPGTLVSVGGSVGFYGLPLRLEAARALEANGRWRVNVYAPMRF